MNFKKIFLFILVIYIIFSPVLTFADDYNESEDLFFNNFIPVSFDATQIPQINARHAIVLDRLSNNILYSKHENEKCKMASTTKILTCIIALENCKNLDDVVTVSKVAARNRWLPTWLIHK